MQFRDYNKDLFLRDKYTFLSWDQMTLSQEQPCGITGRPVTKAEWYVPCQDASPLSIPAAKTVAKSEILCSFHVRCSKHGNTRNFASAPTRLCAYGDCLARLPRTRVSNSCMRHTCTRQGCEMPLRHPCLKYMIFANSTDPREK